MYSRVALRERQDLYQDCKSCLFVEMAGPAGVNTLLVGTIYHTPNTSMVPITDVITRATATGLPLLLLGDYNAHHTHWQEDTKTDQHGTQLFDCINNNQLSVLNNLFNTSRFIPTCTTNSVLDLAITNTPNIFTGCRVDVESLLLQ